MQFASKVAPLCVVGLLPTAILAQSTNARSDSFVQDQAGTLVPNARVDVLNHNTQARVGFTTDVTGAFIFPTLTPGKHALTGEANGFRKKGYASL